MKGNSVLVLIAQTNVHDKDISPMIAVRTLDANCMLLSLNANKCLPLREEYLI